jgi:hypothetical protein
MSVSKSVASPKSPKSSKSPKTSPTVSSIEVTINENTYELTKEKIMTITRYTFQKQANCYITYNVKQPKDGSATVYINIFRSDSEVAGTGRTMMKDLLTYLLMNANFSENTQISLVPEALSKLQRGIVHDNEKLVAYYKKIGFDTELTHIQKKEGNAKPQVINLSLGKQKNRIIQINKYKCITKMCFVIYNGHFVYAQK